MLYFDIFETNSFNIPFQNVWFWFLIFGNQIRVLIIHSALLGPLLLVSDWAMETALSSQLQRWVFFVFVFPLPPLRAKAHWQSGRLHYCHSNKYEELQHYGDKHHRNKYI